ncbi:MAG: hypothetical protein AAGG38_11830 [Planctomycetota bacterium]
MTFDKLAAVLREDGLLQTGGPGPQVGGETWTAAAAAWGVDEAAALHSLSGYWRREAARVQLHRVPHDPAALGYVGARDAWDYLILPLAVEPDGHLLCCTTVETLPTAIARLLNTLSVPFRLVVADIRPLEQYIAEQYRYEGVEVEGEAA